MKLLPAYLARSADERNTFEADHALKWTVARGSVPSGQMLLHLRWVD